MEPDKKLLKKVEADNAALLKKSIYKKEAPTYEDKSATSSDERVSELNK